jgi:hypothetical protein
VTITARRPARQVNRIAPVLILGGLALLPLVVAGSTGAWGLPRNDDWSYSDLLWRWAENGDLRLGGWESMTLVGQLVAAWPIAKLAPRDAASLQVFTAVVGFVGALAAYGTLRRFLDVGNALLATAVTLVSPLYAPLAASFMTDVPAFATQAICAWLGSGSLAASGRRRLVLLVAALAVGAFGVTVREYAVVAPAAVLIVCTLAAWGRRDRGLLTASLVSGAVAVAFTVAFVAWRRSWADSLSLEPSAPSGLGDAASSFGRSILFTVVTLAFLVLPIFAFVPIRTLIRAITSRRSTFVMVVAAAIVLFIGAVTTWDWSPPLLGPYLDQRGALGNDILPGDRHLILPAWLFDVLLLATLAAAILLVGILVLRAADVISRASTWRRRCASFDASTLAWVLVILTVVSLTAAGTAELPLFDRYVLPAVPFAGGLVLAFRSEPSTVFTTPTSVNGLRWLAVAAFALLGLIWSVDSAAFDDARWEAGERVVDLGYPADRVDAGFEWRNWHRLTGQSPTSPSQTDADACVVLAAPGADLGPHAVAVLDVGYWHGLAGRENLTAWATNRSDCPPAPSGASHP